MHSGSEKFVCVIRISELMKKSLAINSEQIRCELAPVAGSDKQKSN